METVKSLQKRISELKTAGRSGIVALYGHDFPTSNDESFWEYHEALVYIQPLDTLVKFQPWVTVYQSGGDGRSSDSLLQDFIDREDELTIEALGMTEKAYLEICTERLVNDMAHDNGECPEQDCEDNNERYTYPSDNDFRYPDTHFTITGAEDIASDIRAIRTAIENRDEISVQVRDGRIKQFCMSMDTDGEYILSTFENAEIKDEDTGENIPVLESVQLLRALDWRTFYAKSRLFIYQNWIMIDISSKV